MKLKTLLLLPVCVLCLLSITGCVAVPYNDGHEHARYEHHDAVVVAPAPVVVVGPPVVIVR